MHALNKKNVSSNIITQQEIDALLASLSWDERIQEHFNRATTRLDEIQFRSPSRDLVVLKHKLVLLLKRFGECKSLSLDRYTILTKEFKQTAERILLASSDLKVFQNLLEIENMIALKFHEIKQERRQSIRFPVSLPGRLLINTQIVPAFLTDIDVTGVQFHCFLPLQNQKRYPLSFETRNLHSLTVIPIHQDQLVTPTETRQRIGTLIEPQLEWSQIKEILVYVFQRPN